MFRKPVTYDNIKSQKKSVLHPFYEKNLSLESLEKSQGEVVQTDPSHPF